MSERPERKKQAEMIVDLLRRRSVAGSVGPAKKVQKKRRRASKPTVSPKSEGSTRAAKLGCGRNVRVHFKILEQPPREEESIWAMVENTLGRLGPRVVSENFYSQIISDSDSNAVLLTNSSNPDDCFELCRGRSDLSARTQAPLDPILINHSKARFNIEYLF